MTTLIRKWLFKASLVVDAPDCAGLYALWQDDKLLHVGHAVGRSDTIRAHLLEQLSRGQAGQGWTPTHYSWEICRNPRERKAQAVAQLQDRGNCRPKEGGDHFAAQAG
jgi:hypothetical protein